MHKPLSRIALDLIETKAVIGTPRQWCKGREVSVSGDRHCLIGAVKTAIGACATTDDAIERYYATTELLRGLLSPQWGPNDIPLFNDAQSTTHADVMDLLDRAIEAVR